VTADKEKRANLDFSSVTGKALAQTLLSSAELPSGSLPTAVSLGWTLTFEVSSESATATESNQTHNAGVFHRRLH